MKLVALFTAAILMMGFSTAQANQNKTEEKEIQVSINDALVPSKVKAYESVKAVISGLFPNGCYKYSRSEVNHNTNSNTHKVRTYAKVSPGMCIMVLVPYTREVELGTFAPGEHHIRFENSDETYMQKTIIAE